VKGHAPSTMHTTYVPGGCSDRERRSLSPEGPWAKVFRSNMRDMCFPKRFRVPNNIVNFYSKINPIV
jgi:hypothetical protein